MAVAAVQENSEISFRESFAVYLRNFVAGLMALIFVVGVLYEPGRQAYHRALDWQAAQGALDTQQSQVPNRSGDVRLDPGVQKQRLQDLGSKYSIKDPSAKLTLVSPLQISDAGRFLIMVSTLRQNLQPKTVAAMILLVPDSDYPAFSSITKFALDFPATVMSESDMFPPHIPSQSANGYTRQMLLKLLVARHVRTEFYLTLDADVLLKRPLNTTSLVRNGKATFNPETFAATKEHWWKGSEKMLDAEGCINRQQPLFGVTPSVLSRRISTLVLDRLQQLHGDDYMYLMVKEWHSQWSEYTLYRIAACYYGVFDTYHEFLGYSVYDTYASAWTYHAAIKWDAMNAFTNETSEEPFALVQGRTHLPERVISRKVHPFVAPASNGSSTVVSALPQRFSFGGARRAGLLADKLHR